MSRADPETDRRRGFTLVEIMVAVVILGLLAAIAIPVAIRVHHRARDARFTSDVRTLAQAFETHALMTGAWPPDANRGVVPAGMSGDFRDQDWTSRNSLGGLWDWDYRQNGITAAISTVEVVVDDDEMRTIDARIDDGDLTTGNFLKIGSNRYSYILQK